MTSGQLEHVMLLPRQSFLPLISGLLTAASVLSLLFKVYWLAALFALGVVVSFIAWSQVNSFTRDLGSMDIGRGASAPPHSEVDHSPPWWAAVFSLLANATLFASLVFGTLYLWLVAPAWPPVHIVDLGAASIAPLVGFAAYALLGRRSISANSAGQPSRALWALIALSVVQIALLAMLLSRIPDPSMHAHLATCFALLLYAAVHAGLCLVFTSNTLLKHHRGATAPKRRVDFAVNKLWYDYTAVTGVLAIVLVLCMPYLIGMLPKAS
jgi:cytochrome c oxidase subunit I+III